LVPFRRDAGESPPRTPGLVVQWIVHKSPELRIQVRFLSRPQDLKGWTKFRPFFMDFFHSLELTLPQIDVFIGEAYQRSLGIAHSGSGDPPGVLFRMPLTEHPEQQNTKSQTLVEECR
jgi:hypothetical protein